MINTGGLSGGQVTLTAVPGESYVRLSQPGQALSLDIPNRPNAWNGSVASLPQLLTGGNLANATGVTVNPDGTVKLTGTDLMVSSGDVAINGSVTAQGATLSAANDLTLAASQVKTEKDLALTAHNNVVVRDTTETPFSVQTGGNLSVQGNQGIDIFALKHPGSYAFQSGGNLSFLSDGIISGDAHFKSGGNLSFQNLAGGSGKFVSLFDPVIYSGGDVDLGSYTGTSLKVEAGGNILAQDITITGPDDSGGIPADDPDHDILTTSPALILRGGLSEPASIISVGNIWAKGGHVELSTNGNIFAGDIDVSNNDPSYQTISYYVSDFDGTQQKKIEWTQQPQGSIWLQAYNIFTGDLKAGSAAPITSYTRTNGNFVNGIPMDDNSFIETKNNSDDGGNISVIAENIFRAGDIDTSSFSGNGRLVNITASDAMTESINTSGGIENTIRDFFGFSYSPPYFLQESIIRKLRGGDVTVNTESPFQSGSITTNGGTPGTVTINSSASQSGTTPNSGNSTDPNNPNDLNGSSTGGNDPTSGQGNTSSGSSNGSSGGTIGGSSGSSSGQTTVISSPSDPTQPNDPIATFDPTNNTPMTPPDNNGK